MAIKVHTSPPSLLSTRLGDDSTSPDLYALHHLAFAPWSFDIPLASSFPDRQLSQDVSTDDCPVDSSLFSSFQNIDLSLPWPFIESQAQPVQNQESLPHQDQIQDDQFCGNSATLVNFLPAADSLVQEEELPPQAYCDNLLTPSCPDHLDPFSPPDFQKEKKMSFPEPSQSFLYQRQQLAFQHNAAEFPVMGAQSPSSNNHTYQLPFPNLYRDDLRLPSAALAHGAFSTHETLPTPLSLAPESPSQPSFLKSIHPSPRPFTNLPTPTPTHTSTIAQAPPPTSQSHPVSTAPQNPSPATASSQSSAGITETKMTRRARSGRPRNKWSENETAHLLWGVAEYGIGNWKKILTNPKYSFDGRTAVDLKDRFRTCCPHYYGKQTSKRLQSSEGGRMVIKIDRQKTVVDPLSTLQPGAQTSVRKRRAKTDRKSDADLAELGITTLFVYPRRCQRRPFTDQEDENILLGFDRYGPQWNLIRNDPQLGMLSRSRTDIRDRFRNRYPDLFLARGQNSSSALDEDGIYAEGYPPYSYRTPCDCRECWSAAHVSLGKEGSSEQQAGSYGWNYGQAKGQQQQQQQQFVEYSSIPTERQPQNTYGATYQYTPPSSTANCYDLCSSTSSPSSSPIHSRPRSDRTAIEYLLSPSSEESSPVDSYFVYQPHTGRERPAAAAGPRPAPDPFPSSTASSVTLPYGGHSQLSSFGPAQSEPAVTPSSPGNSSQRVSVHDLMNPV